MKFLIATTILLLTFLNQTYCQGKNKIGFDLQLENEPIGIVKLPKGAMKVAPTEDNSEAVFKYQ